MLDTLTLKNFRKHVDLEIKFSDGLTVIRGANEKGKTTLGEAILYAMFGSKMLRESLSEVVTWGMPENSLKVALTWTLNGVDYKIVRGKSGAELAYGDILVTGQNETRAAVERILQCSADTAKLLMFADQNAVRGVLAEGGGAANGLVEKLANLGIIEQLVDKVQLALPSGNTKAMDAQIETLKGASVTVPEMPDESQIQAASEEICRVQEKIDLSESRRPAVQEVANAVATIEAKNAAQRDLTRLTARQVEIRAILASPVAVPGFTLEDLEQARKDAANIPEQERRYKAYNVKFPTAAHEWDASMADLLEAKALSTAELQRATDKLATAKTAIEIAKLKKINEKTCAFCQKDLTDVPEVEAINIAADAAVKQASADADAAQSHMASSKSELLAYEDILKVTAAIEKLAGDYWDLGTCIPPKPTWKGAVPTKPGTSNLPAMEREWVSYQASLTRHTVLREELAAIQLPAIPDTAEAEATVKLSADLTVEVSALKAEKVQAEHRHSQAKSSYASQVALRDSAIQANANNQKALAQLEETRTAMLKNNELIKKLRAARPEIASKMWGTVLGAISLYFTKMRGEDSIVTRDPKSFQVNGRNVDGLSGSTQDALGLSIRMALSKLFLPSIPFLFLDESFSGCDDNREINGVSTLAGAGFSQVLLVTHSETPGSLADSLIVL